MRPISPTQRCVSGNVCKQTSPEILKVICTRRTIMVFFARDVSDMGYRTGGEIMASLLLLVTHMQFSFRDSVVRFSF